MAWRMYSDEVVMFLLAAWATAFTNLAGARMCRSAWDFRFASDTANPLIRWDHLWI
jgi:hypothetical protein